MNISTSYMQSWVKERCDLAKLRIRDNLIKQGYSEEEVERAIEETQFHITAHISGIQFYSSIEEILFERLHLPSQFAWVFC